MSTEPAQSEAVHPNLAARTWLGLGAWVSLCFLPSLAGIFFRPENWYEQLNKPSWNPPGWVFGPVWTTLYLLMGIAAWLVWKRAGFRGARTTLIVFAIQLLLNAAWSPLFFGAKRPDLALIDIVLLWLAIAATLVCFWRVRPVAAMLLAPYLAWVSFALILNFALWQMNS